MTGSLRAASRNTSVLLACARLLPATADLDLFRELDALPHFSPDVDDHHLPAAVTALHARLAAADAVLVSSPEYAHGVPGSFKNALDWLVGVGLGRRPVGLINASPLSIHAHAHLAEILATMDGVLARDAVLVLPFAPRPRPGDDPRRPRPHRPAPALRRRPRHRRPGVASHAPLTRVQALFPAPARPRPGDPRRVAADPPPNASPSRPPAPGSPS